MNEQTEYWLHIGAGLVLYMIPIWPPAAQLAPIFHPLAGTLIGKAHFTSVRDKHASKRQSSVPPPPDDTEEKKS